MAEALDPREVLTHLNDMGFYNITAQQLKEFIYDLKKLMKYDLHKTETINDAPVTQRDDLFDYLYKTSTTSFKAKCAKKKKEYVPIPDDKKKPSTVQHKRINRATSDDFANVDIASSTKYSNAGYSEPICEKAYGKYLSTDSLYTDTVDQEFNLKTNSNVPIKYSKSKAFIRPRAPKKSTNKSDPVALYHAYQADWNKFKNQMPGQSNRNALRWNIRERMMGDPR